MIENITNNLQSYTTELSQHRSISAAQISMHSFSGNDGESSFSGDQVSLSYFKIEESITYSSAGSMQSTLDAAYDLLRSHVLDVFEKQGMDFTLAIDDKTIDLRELSQNEAKELIAEDGYFGVDQTSDRIVDFAKGISGNDPTRLDAILQGIEKGFNEALEAFGGWLPEISHTTYDTVLEKLNNWAREPQAV